MRLFFAVFLLASNALACDKIDSISSKGMEIFVSCPAIISATDDEIADITYKLVVSGEFDNSNEFLIRYTQATSGHLIATYSSTLNTVLFKSVKKLAPRQVVLRI